MPAPRAVLFALAAALGLSACFYDSRWGEAKRAQQKLATKAAPADISPSTDPERPAPDGGRRAWRVRVRPDGRYLAQNIDAPRRIAELLDDAGRVLGPSIALDLALDRIQPWTNDADDDVGAALAALRGGDTGDDVDLVVGMIGSLPRQSDSLHDEGMATLLGKHVVVRGASRAGELDSIQLTFGELSETDRARLLERRRHHRARAALLHEIGHCLGAIHEIDVGSLMRPVYDPKMTGFGGGAIALMRAGLDSGDRSAVASAQLVLLERVSNATWIPAERDAEMVRLRTVVGPAAATAPVASTASAASEDAPPELRGDARARFLRAQELLRGNAVAAAYGAVKPLFTEYPASYAVQDLRCQLATVRWLPREQMLAECAPSGGLSRDAGTDAR